MDETTPRKRRRATRYVPDIDRRLIGGGLPPSREDHVRPKNTCPGFVADAPDRDDGANDARLPEDVPLHARVWA